MFRAQELINQLTLVPHPEGGYYKEIFRSPDIVIAPDRFETNDHKRSASTIIYFLMLSDNFSAFHKIKADETWTFVEGNPITIHMIDPESRKYKSIKLGHINNPKCQPITIIPHDTWFAAEVTQDDGYCLVNCHVSPGFEFSDFELANREQLSSQFSEHVGIISRLTKITHPTKEKTGNEDEALDTNDKRGHGNSFT